MKLCADGIESRFSKYFDHFLFSLRVSIRNVCNSHRPSNCPDNSHPSPTHPRALLHWNGLIILPFFVWCWSLLQRSRLRSTQRMPLRRRRQKSDLGTWRVKGSKTIRPLPKKTSKHQDNCFTSKHFPIFSIYFKYYCAIPLHSPCKHTMCIVCTHMCTLSIYVCTVYGRIECICACSVHSVYVHAWRQAVIVWISCHKCLFVFQARSLIHNDKCQTCQCLNGGLLCLSKTCSPCSKVSDYKANTCVCVLAMTSVICCLACTHMLYMSVRKCIHDHLHSVNVMRTLFQ